MSTPEGKLIFAGEELLVVGAEIHNFKDTGLRFQEPKGVHPRPKSAKVTKVVLHSTSSERVGRQGAEDIFRNMSARKDAGCHLAITNDGQVWQLCDLVTDMASHVSHSIVNPASIGIEVSNYQWVKDHSKVTGPGKDREKYKATIHGWTSTHADYYPAQHQAVLIVCSAICKHLGIPLDVMLAPWRVRSNQELRDFSGVHGHLHCALGEHPKTDPGTRPLETLARSWGLIP
jgi:N-acetyl-anhydromuramyl-L-alanine amidase AmpD